VSQWQRVHSLLSCTYYGTYIVHTSWVPCLQLTTMSATQLSWTAQERRLMSILSSWWAWICLNLTEKESEVQYTRMYFNMSACLHCNGIHSGGRPSTFCNAPSQSEYITTFPPRPGNSWQILSRTKWTAIRPSNSPQYAFADRDCSANEPTNLPVPAVHSKKKGSGA
jgi:hypothetical protein